METVSCIVCNSDSYKKLFRSKDRLLRVDDTEYQIVKCKQCGMVYVNPQPTLGEIARYYPSNYSPYLAPQVFKDSRLLRTLDHWKQYLFENHPRVANQLKTVRQKLTTLQSKQEGDLASPTDSEAVSCLDFGCGGGRHMEALRAEHPGWDISGLDNNPTACESASAKGFHVYCGSAEKVQLPKNGFDRIYMNSVIEHLHDPRGTLKIINAALKPGGALRVMTPNISSVGARLFRQYWHALDTPRHLHLFNQKTLGTILNETGFKVVGVNYKKGMSDEIKSVYHLLRREDRRMSPVIWRITVPVGNGLAKFGLASTLIVSAEKVRDV